MGADGGVGMQCKYVKQDGSRCNREALPDSERGYCILHEDWEHKDEEETKKEFYREIEERTTDFEGCILPKVDMSFGEFVGDLNFRNATINGGAWFAGATIEGNARFEGATINGNAWFEEATINGDASFKGAIINGDASFKGAIIERNAWFEGATIKGSASFEEQ